MACVTWGLNGKGEATLFCAHCRAVFLSDVPSWQAREAKPVVEKDHHCTLPLKCRLEWPGVRKESDK